MWVIRHLVFFVNVGGLCTDITLKMHENCAFVNGDTR
jgi:hypothetical protein